MSQSTAELLAPPTDAEVEQGLRRFARAARDHYGERLHGLFLYGSRARGDQDEEYDAAVVAVLGGELDFWRELCVLSDLSYDQLVDHHIVIDAKPVALSAWNGPTTAADPSWIRLARREGTHVEIGA
jgi:hypothetical protein